MTGDRVLARVRAALAGPPVTRFAPGPTGHLHLGHVVNAVATWGLAQALGGRVLLRVEDVDRGRSRSEYERAILDDLAWLGLAWDGPITRQSEREDVYQAALARLRTATAVYACACSRRDIEQVAPAAPHEEARYPGTCRHIGLAEGPGTGLRAALPEAVVTFEDAWLGPQRQEPWRQCGDLLVRDRLGQWTYQFAVTVDDLAQGVTLVVRGQDILPSTGRQCQLAALLGRAQPPVFAHHPLVLDAAGRKLSKSDRAVGISALRESGWSPALVLGEAARLAGLAAERREVPAAELGRLFGG